VSTISIPLHFVVAMLIQRSVAEITCSGTILAVRVCFQTTACQWTSVFYCTNTRNIAYRVGFVF